MPFYGLMLLLAMTMQPPQQPNIVDLTTASTFTIADWQPKNLTITGDGTDILVEITLATGEVKFGPNYKPTVAAEAFWKAIAAESPMKLRATIAELEKKCAAQDVSGRASR